uniref:Uncharacterized protein n=1 Tax=Ditylenchus dipsaci TaxID=166011 RepID=A0A915DKZ3_9BILA
MKESAKNQVLEKLAQIRQSNPSAEDLIFVNKIDDFKTMDVAMIKRIMSSTLTPMVTIIMKTAKKTPN